MTARVDAEIRKGWGIIAFVLCLLLILALTFLKSPYLRFLEKDQEYYAELARACDSLLAQYPLGTNQFLDVPVTSSLPEVISDLQPSRLTISSNRVWFLAGVQDFGVVWEHREDYSNSWVLSAIGGPERVVFVETKQ